MPEAEQTRRAGRDGPSGHDLPQVRATPVAPQTPEIAEEPALPAGGGEDLRAQIVSGIKWKTLSAITAQGSRAVVAVLLAHLLAPEDFGVAAVAILFSAIAINVTDLQMGSALIQRKVISEVDRATVFWTSTAFGFALMVLVIAVAGPVAGFFNEPDVQPLLWLISVCFLIQGLVTTHVSLLMRDLNFKRYEQMTIASALISVVVGVGAALLGAGAYAIVLQPVAGGVVYVVLLALITDWRPSFTYSAQSLKEMGRFGLNVLGTRLVALANQNTGTVMVGRFLNTTALGVYSISYNLIIYPLGRIATPITDVLFPALSRVQDDPDRMRAGWLRASAVLMALGAPTMFGLAALADEFQSVVLGGQWGDAVPVIEALAVVGLAQLLYNPGYSVLLAADRSGRLMWFNLFSWAATIAAFAIGLEWGLVGVAFAYAIANAVTMPVLIWMSAKAAEGTFMDYVRACGGPFLAAAVMAGAVLVAREGLLALGTGDALRLPILIVVGAAVFLPLCRWWTPDVANEIRRFLSRRRAAAAPAPAEG